MFACGPADLLEVVRLPHPIESRAIVDDHPCVEPLVRNGAGERWCVLLVNRRTARIFLGQRDGLEEVDQIQDDVHRQHDQGGWSQANYQRSVEQEKLNHLGHALATLFTRFKQQPFDHLVVGAPDEMAARGRGAAAPVPARARWPAGSASTSRTPPPAPSRRPRRRSSSVTSRRSSARRSTGWRRGSAAATAASRGPAAVMEALEQARVEILLLAEDFDAPELDDALEKAITQSAEVLVVRHHDDLVMHGGIGAVLRF